MENAIERNSKENGKSLKSGKKVIVGSFVLIAALSFAITGCKKDMGGVLPQEKGFESFDIEANYKITNLVSDLASHNTAHVDPNLVNAWGMAFEGNTVWISSADKGFSVVYDKEGNNAYPVISIPFGSDPNGGNPTGIVYNTNGSSFMIPSSNEASKFIYATENGTIAAWASGRLAFTVADRSSVHAVYKGLAIISQTRTPYIYATDFHNARIDVFDGNFQLVNSFGFYDTRIPMGYAPFGIRAIGTNLLVTYAKQKSPDNEDDEPGIGNGYVDLYASNGTLLKRFASEGTLNSPWGIAVTGNGSETPTFDDAGMAVLIGNFGDGTINVFKGDGTYVGQVQSNGSPLHIDGLWAISYSPTSFEGGLNIEGKLYFTAGPGGESHGLFGYVMK